jgi:hypothetical protein
LSGRSSLKWRQEEEVGRRGFCNHHRQRNRQNPVLGAKTHDDSSSGSLAGLIGTKVPNVEIVSRTVSQPNLVENYGLCRLARNFRAGRAREQKKVAALTEQEKQRLLASFAPWREICERR